jgi:hypothetical protein
MANKFYHVLAAVGDRKVQMLFADLDEVELDKQFVKPYRRGKTFFAGSQIVNPAELRAVQIIETSMREDVTRRNINRASLAQIDEMNRTSGVMIISAGQGYEPGDLVEAGKDVTRSYLTGGPGSSMHFWGLSKTVVGWTLGIVAGVIATGLAKLLGWA